MASTEVYATLAQFRQANTTLGLAGADKYDPVIEHILESVSRVIDAFCQAQDGFVAIANPVLIASVISSIVGVGILFP